MSIEAMKQALEFIEATNKGSSLWLVPASQLNKTVTDLRQAIEQAEKQEPWVWQQAPIKTQWGDEMVVADLAIDKDHTVSVYCERDQTKNVEAMFTPPAANRPWVGLTDEEILSDDILRYYYGMNGGAGPVSQKGKKVVAAIEAKLKEKNNG